MYSLDGPTVEHVKKFVVAKALSTFSVTDAFPKWTGEVRGRLTLRTNRLSEVWLLDSLSLGQEPVTYVVRDEK